MLIRKLKLPEIKDIYRKHMRYDFPYEELRPLPRIVKHFREQKYKGFGGYGDKGELLCYAMFYVRDRVSLFDYLAVLPRYRDMGVGSEFLQYLRTCFPRMDCVFVEVEDPDRAGEEEEQRLRRRRMEFYLRNGFLDTGVEARVFGVDYKIMEMLPAGRSSGRPAYTAEEMRGLCEGLYRSMFPKFFYERFCELH